MEDCFLIALLGVVCFSRTALKVLLLVFWIAHDSKQRDIGLLYIVHLFPRISERVFGSGLLIYSNESWFYEADFVIRYVGP